MLLVICYLLIGVGFAQGRIVDIAADSIPEDRLSTILSALRWVVTWPWWIGK